MNILVLNCGSSSLKFQIIETDSEKIKTNSDKELAKGLIEKVGSNEAVISFNVTGHNESKYQTVVPIADHKVALASVIEWLMKPTTHIDGVKGLQDIHAIGHRTVHGSETFNKSIKIDAAVIKELEANIELAPLHNPANLKGISAAYEVFGKDAPQVGIFDTAFHSTMPMYSFLYGIPFEYYQKYKVRKYGFHGTSHRYIAIRYRALTGKSIAETNIISLHLGNGGSIAAIKNGKSMDTTMGFTPLEGLLMGTRCGDIDPTVAEFLMHKENKTLEQVITILNKESGILGISGISNDMRDIEKGVEENNDRAKLAQQAYCYRIKKYIGAYLAAMNGADAICFTAGVGENDHTVRKMICDDMEYAGLEFDVAANQNFKRGEETLISKPNSKIKVYIIPTNEELMIARDTYCIVSGQEIKE
jgi:acetate kinase